MFHPQEISEINNSGSMIDVMDKLDQTDSD